MWSTAAKNGDHYWVCEAVAVGDFEMRILNITEKGELMHAINLLIDRTEASQKIGEMKEISTTIASAVEEQSAATQEIARNVEQAAAGTTDVSSGIAHVREATGNTQQAATKVLGASEQLSKQETVLLQLREQMHEFIEEIIKSRLTGAGTAAPVWIRLA